MTPPPSQGSSFQGLLYNLLYRSLRSPISWSSSPNSSKYFLSSSILYWSFSSSSLSHSSILLSLHLSFSSSILFQNGFLLYFENRFLFHFLQFFPIFFQYSHSYLLLPCKALDHGQVTLILNLLFIRVWQRELVRVLASFHTLLIHIWLFVCIYWSNVIT